MKRLSVNKIEKILCQELNDIRLDQFTDRIIFKENGKHEYLSRAIHNDNAICEIFKRLFKRLS